VTWVSHSQLYFFSALLLKIGSDSRTPHPPRQNNLISINLEELRSMHN
jgi:hypothetical protein